MLKKHPVELYAGLTGAGKIKLGKSTCIPRREREHRCEDPDYKTMFTVAEGDLKEQELLKLVKSYGFKYGRSREVVDMSLSLVSDIMAGRPPVGGKSGRDLLKAFLEAELEPGLSVEQACYPCTYTLPLEDQPSLAEVMRARRLLNAAGIEYCVVDPTEPGYVVLEEPLRFAQQFPTLKHIIPFVMYSKGVWVQTSGIPLDGKRPALSVAPAPAAGA